MLVALAPWTLKAGLACFAPVFGTGFVRGTIRVPSLATARKS